jgi:hypothetical protein
MAGKSEKYPWHPGMYKGMNTYRFAFCIMGDERQV